MAHRSQNTTTIREVARHAGVSRATVSNVLHGRDSHVAHETKESVLRAIKDLNYRPPLSTSQAAELSYSLGLLIQNQDAHPLTRHGYYVPVFEGFLTGALQHKRSVTIMNESLWESAHKGIRQYCDGRIDGILVAAPPIECAFVDELKSRGFPMVVMGGCQDDPEIATVNCENKEGGRKAASHLASLGHVNLAYIGFGPEKNDCRLRQIGFEQEIAAQGLHRPQVFHVGGELGSADMVRMVMGSPEKGKCPTAIFCFNDEIASKILAGLRGLGFRVPAEVSVVGFDQTVEAIREPEVFTTIRQPIRDMALQAASLLVELTSPMRNGERRPVTKLVYQPELIVGRTTGPVPIRTGAVMRRSSTSEQPIATESHIK